MEQLSFTLEGKKYYVEVSLVEQLHQWMKDNEPWKKGRAMLVQEEESGKVNLVTINLEGTR